MIVIESPVVGLVSEPDEEQNVVAELARPKKSKASFATTVFRGQGRPRILVSFTFTMTWLSEYVH